MKELIITWLSEQGVPESYLELGGQLVGFSTILLIALIGYYIAKVQFVAVVHKVIKRSRNQWDDLFIEHKVFERAASLLPFIIFLFLIPLFLHKQGMLAHLLVIFAKVGICFQVARAMSALLNVVKSTYGQKARERYVPLNSAIQVIKLIVFLVASILAISVVLDRSPIYLLSGLGALTAVLLLVFQDTIKGLVASIQISANRMVAPGDWIELPKYGADGDVLEIGLSTVKVQNFDRTITTVPTYALISGSFKNWRDMFNSGGRRIKRSVIVDISSIHFLSEEKIKELKELNLIGDYLAQKKDAIAKDEESILTKEVKPAGKRIRRLTNVGTFRAYIEAYLKSHEKVNDQMTCMVRQLAATQSGLPLELYFFSNDQNWVNYEVIQADIFDHVFAVAPLFDIRIFQHPSGYDWANYNN